MKLNSIQILFIQTFIFLSFCAINGQQKSSEIDYNIPYDSVVKNTVHFKDSLGNETNLPIVTINGKKKGKTLTILAGVHGYEYPPIMAVQQFIGEIETEKLSGRLIILPISSVGSFFGRTLYMNPIDKVNLNNAFPGNKNGTVTQQIAHYITTEIIPISDVFLDIHGGDASEDLMPFVCYYNHEKKPKQTAKAKELSELSGFSNVVSYPYTISDNEKAKYAFKQAVQDGKVGLSFEAGKLGNVQSEAVLLNKNGIYLVMKNLGMYHSNIQPSLQLKKYANQVYIKAEKQGIFYTEMKAGDYVTKNEEIGYITDVFGDTIKKIRATANGVILYMIATPPVNATDTLFCLGIPE